MTKCLIGRAWLIAAVVFLKMFGLDAQSCQWTLYNETNIYNGNQSTASSLSDCQATCLSTSGCQSVDWAPENPTGSQCYLLGKKTDKYSTKNVFHYDLDCSDNCTFFVVNDSNIFGGIGIGATSLRGCKYACRLYAGCQSVDWVPGDPVGRQCYLLSVQFPTQSSPGVNHYDLQCTNGSETTYSTSNLTKSTAETTATTATTANATTAKATTAKATTGTTAKATTGTTAKATTATTAKATTGTTAKVTTGTTAKATTATTAKATTATTTGGEPSTPLNDCRINYEFSPATSSLGGFLVAGLTDAFSCGAACTVIKRCLGIDFGPSAGCWLHYNASMFAQKYYQSDVTQFKINRCPEDGIKTCFESLDIRDNVIDSCSAVCFPKWARFENRAGSGGQPEILSSIRSMKSCLKECFNRPDCFGIEWSSSPASELAICALYNSSQQQAFRTADIKPFVTQYKLLSRCGTYCTASWTLYDNTIFRAVGKTTVTNVTTASACSDVCRLSKSCFMYQITKSGPFVCTLADDFFVGSAAANESVSTYTRTLTCNETSLPPTPNPQTFNSSSEQSTTVQQITTDFQMNCEWRLFNGSFIYQGTGGTAKTLTECQSECMATQTCRGIDWAFGNQPGNQCFLHSEQDPKYSGSGVDHYDLDCKGL